MANNNNNNKFSQLLILWLHYYNFVSNKLLIPGFWSFPLSLKIEKGSISSHCYYFKARSFFDSLFSSAFSFSGRSGVNKKRKEGRRTVRMSPFPLEKGGGGRE